MVTLEQMARAALDGDALTLRSIVQAWLRTNPSIAEIACPATHDPTVLATSAALIELFAQRLGQSAPPWANRIGGLPEAKYLVRSAMTMKRLRKMCEEESPWPLKRRNLFAPADYLTFI